MNILLFLTGFFVSVFTAFIVRRLLKGGRQEGAGWVYLGAISLRLVALLFGCTVVYLTAGALTAQYLGAFALGIAAGWITHFAFALVALRK